MGKSKMHFLIKNSAQRAYLVRNKRKKKKKKKRLLGTDKRKKKDLHAMEKLLKLLQFVVFGKRKKIRKS